MVSLWIIIGLILATLSVSALGATFSIVGLGALFSGAALAVWVMAGSLEFAKFVLAAYLHQRWLHLNKVFRAYLVFAIFVLSFITSMGIFGFLSDAYQSASSAIDAENIKFDALKAQQEHNTNEIARLNKAIDEIPDNRISRKMKARAEAEPMILQLTKSNDQILTNLTQSNLRMHEIKKRVGPLIYIARAFQVEIDTAVKYLIFTFVIVFDPLAICLVIATSQALETRRRRIVPTQNKNESQAEPFTFTATEKSSTPPDLTAELAPAPTEPEVLEMRFSESEDNKDRKAV
jgi:hypothetical protein